MSGPTIPRWKLYVPYPQYSSGTASGISSSFVPWANSIYNAAQLRIEKRFSGGLQFLFSYVFQKSIDDSSLGSSGYSFLTGGSTTSESSARDPNNLRLDRSLSVFSIPQIAQLSFLYQLPFGKHLTRMDRRAAGRVAGERHLSQSTTGFPFSSSCAAAAASACRPMATNIPNLLAPLQVAGTGNLNQYFANPQVAVKPAPYSDGDAPRVLSNARIPGTDNLTASLFKEVPSGFREGARLQIRLEAFNVLNRVQFAAPDANVGDATFGEITSQANQPRQLQIGLKLYYLA